MDARAGGQCSNHIIVVIMFDAQKGLGLAERKRLDRRRCQ
jgi:hypothetical protein